MKVHLTKQTYPYKEFLGVVSQIRLQTIQVINVVNYQVVIDITDGLLFIGMTPNLEFITKTACKVCVIGETIKKQLR